MRVITMIDYDAGDLRSMEKALTVLGGKSVITSDSHEILSADKVILPGVGSFGDAMGRLHQYGLVDVIRQVTDQGTSFLGVCLGLRLMLESNEESVGVEGLGLLRGTIKKVPDCPRLRIPHMGWNSPGTTPGVRLFQSVEQGAYMYFVYSCHLEAEDERIVATSTQYSTRIRVSVESGNVFVCQFHPEKGSSVGLRILKNFIEINQNLTS